MSDCNHDCGSCDLNCEERKDDFTAPLNQFSSVKKVIGIVSGKGGVGKSTVTALLATASARKGFKTAVLDADVTGPSMAAAFGIKDKIRGNEMGMIPPKTKLGIKTVSVNMMLENESDPVVWRGPVLAGVVKQFWSDVWWDDIDYMFVDMPPGTGDIPLTVFQSLPLDGIIIVTTPQQLVGMIVEKAVKMARLMNIPVLGLVENMSYVKCPDCGKKIELFGPSELDLISKRLDIRATARMALDPAVAALCDAGRIEEAPTDDLKTLDKVIFAEKHGKND